MALKPSAAKITDFETSFEAVPTPSADGLVVWADVQIAYVLGGFTPTVTIRVPIPWDEADTAAERKSKALRAARSLIDHVCRASGVAAVEAEADGGALERSRRIPLLRGWRKSLVWPNRQVAPDMIITALGYLAAICSTLSFAPQAWKIIRTAATRDISAGMFADRNWLCPVAGLRHCQTRMAADPLQRNLPGFFGVYPDYEIAATAQEAPGRQEVEILTRAVAALSLSQPSAFWLLKASSPTRRPSSA